MELWARKCPVILSKSRLPHKFRDLVHAANLRHGTDDFTSPPKEGVLRIFRPNNPTASAGFKPANLGTKGQHVTPRPPKPFYYIITYKIKEDSAKISPNMPTAFSAWRWGRVFGHGDGS